MPKHTGATENKPSREAEFSSALWKLGKQADPARRSVAVYADRLRRLRLMVVIASVLGVFFFLWWFYIGRFPVIHNPGGLVSTRQIGQIEDLLHITGEQRVLAINFIRANEAWATTKNHVGRLRKYHLTLWGSRWAIDATKEWGPQFDSGSE
jgi:hypothetical protein